MDEDASLVDIVFDQVVEGVEEDSDIFVLAVQQGVDDVHYCRVVPDVVHVPGCCHN